MDQHACSNGERWSLGGKYTDFTYFSLSELTKHIGLYVFHELPPSPQVEMKFNPSDEDPVNGNNFIHHAFGSNGAKATRRHRHFKCFFTSTNPCATPVSRETHPNWKVHPLLKHVLSVSKAAVFLGRHLSCDEQTMGFQGMSIHKQRITYKAEGNGFLVDCICSDGYTYNFYFRHQQASEKIMKTYYCSPLHARVLGLISQLPDKNYTLGLDNLYMSTKFCRLAMLMDQRVMLHGVTRVTGRGVPTLVKQKEVTRKGDLEAVRNTVKVARLKGDTVCKDLICISVYDIKPVYFLSNASKEIKWIKKEKNVYDKTKKCDGSNAILAFEYH